jgi:hypothetical protein
MNTRAFTLSLALLGLGSSMALSAIAATPLNEAQRVEAQQKLAQLRDPVLRAQRRAADKVMMIRTMTEQLAYAGLSPQEIEVVLEDLSDSSAQLEERSIECRMKNPCDADAVVMEARDVANRKLEMAVGPDRLPRLREYPDWRTINSFRQLLPARQRFSDEVAAQLVTIITEERARTGTPGVTTSFGERLRNRAGLILTPDQLARLIEMRRSWFAGQ